MNERVTPIKPPLVILGLRILMVHYVCITVDARVDCVINNENWTIHSKHDRAIASRKNIDVQYNVAYRYGRKARQHSKLAHRYIR